MKTRTFSILKCEFLQRLFCQVVGTVARLLSMGYHCNDNEKDTNALKDAPDQLPKRLGPTFGMWLSHRHVVGWRAVKEHAMEAGSFWLVPFRAL